MSNPYSQPTLVGYNANAPSDDGSETAANTVKWSTHKDKHADPLKNFAQAVDSNVATAFGKIFGATISSQAGDYTIASGDQGKFVVFTASATATLLPAASAGNGFALAIINDAGSTNQVTIDADGSETINGDATITLNPGDAAILTCNGSAWNAAICRAYLLDEDDMASDSATVAPSQQSVKAYVDTGDVWVDLGTTTFSSSSEFELALSATYREYRIVLEEFLPATNDQGIVATVSDGSYKSSGYVYSVMRQTSTTVDAVASSSAASILLTFSGGLGNVDTEEAFGEIRIKGHQNANGQCQITSHIVCNDAGVPEQYWAQGRYLTDGAITAFKFIMASGNIASGTATVYALKA